MKISGGMKEHGIVIGNVFDKYGSRNPIVRRLMRSFEDTLFSLVVKAAPRTIHEVGCGEGYWVLQWCRQGIAARGTDFSGRAIGLARANAAEHGVMPGLFEERSIYDLEPDRDSADLIVCCEVLEHLQSPVDGLRALQRIATDYVILSVPREPVWRLLNMARGKYLSSFGNTPGHIQHWSRSAFEKLVECHFDITEVCMPVPWIMVLCRVRR